MTDLDFCPHSSPAHQHRWHGLPVSGCGGSHLNAYEAKRAAKPFGPNEEKYPGSLSQSFYPFSLEYFFTQDLSE
jgi:hypothetical protein